jgi:hypothetical protein
MHAATQMALKRTTVNTSSSGSSSPNGSGARPVQRKSIGVAGWIYEHEKPVHGQATCIHTHTLA